MLGDRCGRPRGTARASRRVDRRLHRGLEIGEEIVGLRADDDEGLGMRRLPCARERDSNSE